MSRVSDPLPFGASGDVGDVMQLGPAFGDCTFDAAIDKGTMDALLVRNAVRLTRCLFGIIASGMDDVPLTRHAGSLAAVWRRFHRQRGGHDARDVSRAAARWLLPAGAHPMYAAMPAPSLPRPLPALMLPLCVDHVWRACTAPAIAGRAELGRQLAFHRCALVKLTCRASVQAMRARITMRTSYALTLLLDACHAGVSHRWPAAKQLCAGESALRQGGPVSGCAGSWEAAMKNIVADDHHFVYVCRKRGAA